jgi:hypothetical protein
MATESIDTDIDLGRGGPAAGSNRGTNTANNDAVIAGTKTQSADPDDITVKVVDDMPPDDRGRRPLDPNLKSAVPSEDTTGDDEIGKYSQNVQQRLRQMRLEYHEERRAKEAMMREHGAAVQFAQNAFAENQRLRRLIEEGHKTMLESGKLAADSELAALQQNLKAALEAGNSEAAADLQGKIARVAARSVSIEQTTPIRFEEPPPQQQVVQPQWGQPQPRQQQIQLSPIMQDWLRQNTWFNQDKLMTSYAFGLHDKLVEQGVLAESQPYFKTIDAEMRRVFPQAFTSGHNSAQGQSRTVAGASRLAGDGRSGDYRSNPREVQLTSSELVLAKRLGVTPTQYAKEKLRLQESNNG